MMRTLWTLVTTVTLLLAGATGCAVSEKEELQLGLENHGKFEAESGGRYEDPQVQAYVTAIGREMARYAGRPEMKWEFHVLNSDQINAFAVPGGYIYITQGLLFRLTNEAQLAGVLGHEAGHIAYRHSARSIETQRYVGVATAGVSILAQQAGYSGAGQAAQMLSQFGMLKYSRDHETQADYAGLQYMTQAGYNPQGMVQVMQVLKQASGSGGGGPLGDWTLTHPDPGNRIAYLTDAINEKYRQATITGKLGQEEFARAVLSRRRGALLPMPADWCLTCRESNVAVAEGSGQELLRDAAN